MSARNTATGLAAFSVRNRDGLKRSFRFFLLGVIVACGIEVAVDWNATLGEVRALRARVKERGQNYAAVLVRPLAPAVARGDAKEVEHLAAGVFDDEEVVFVRVIDPKGSTLYERIDPAFAASFEAKRKTPFATYYAHQLERDAKGIVTDPEGLRARMEKSQYRDFAQAYQDFLITLHVAKPDRIRLRSDGVILFQDRLYTSNKIEHDKAVTYALGRIEIDPETRTAGAVIVAFDMQPTNDAIRGKYLKGAGLVVFFVLLILVQNVSSRREKLRLFDLEGKYASAKASIRDALPTPLETATLRAAGAIAQSVGSVDGMLWDASQDGDGIEIVAIDPEGEGVEAAAVALHVRATYRHRRDDGVHASLDEELAALGRAAMRIPGNRPLAVVLFRVTRDGAIEGVRSGMSAPRLVEGERVTKLDETPRDAAPDGITPPVLGFATTLPAGAMLMVASDGVGGAVRRIDPDVVTAFAARTRARSETLAALTTDVATWARGTSADVAQDDILIVAVERRV